MAVPGVPAAPVVVDVAARTATATWAHPTGSNPPILDYRLQLSTRSNFSVITSTVSGITGGSSGVSFGMFNLQRATNYWVRVQARNADGYSAWSSGGAFTTLPEVPSAPRNLDQVLSPISEYAHGRFKAKWLAPSSNGGGQITGYDVQASLSGTFGTIAASWSGNALIAQLTGLSYGRGYFVRVRAKNSAGNGPWVQSVTWAVGGGTPHWDFATSYEVPATPTSLVVARVSDAQQSLSWNLTTSTSAPVHRVRVQRWDSVSLAWTPVALLTGAATSWVDGGTVAGREYQYRVLAENDFAARVKQSAYSSVATVFTSPIAPVSAVAHKTPSEAIEVTITRATSGYVTDFEVQHRADGGAWVALGTTTGVMYTHPSPNPSQTHQYRVRAVKGALGSGWVETGIVSLAAPPLAPTGLRLEGENTYGGNSFLGWTAFDLVWDFNAGPDTAGQTEFEAEFMRVSDSSWLPLASGGTETRTEFDGLGGTGGGLLFRVRTKGTESAGWGDWSDTFLATEFTFADQPAIIEPTTTVTEVPFDVRWDLHVVADAQTRVRVDVYQADAQVDSVTVTPSVGTNQGEAALDTPLIGGESYEIRVSVSRSGGIFWSEPAVVTVTADFPVPAPPTVEAYWEADTATAVVTVINPKTEAATNTYPTPSFELPGADVVLETNLCPNPTAVAGGATIGVTSNGIRWTVTRGATVPATPDGTTTAAQGQPIEGMDDGLIMFAYNLDGLGNTSPARTVTLRVRSNVQFDFRAGGTTWTHPNLAPDQWHTITLTAPANAHLLGAARRAGGAAPQPTDRFWWTDITTADEFFTGDTPPDPDFTAAWTGAPNNSSSTLSGVRALGVLGVGVQSTQWAASGSHSLRLLDGEYADIGTGPIQFKARATGQIFLVDSIPHIAVEGVNQVSSGLVSLGPGWWDDVSTAEDFFTGDTPDTETYQYAWAGTPNNSASERLPLTVETVNNHIQRRTDNGGWITIGEALPGEQIRDHTAPLTPTLEYRAIAISAVPSTTAGPELALPWVHNNCPVFVNGGLDFGTAVTAAGMGEHSHAVNTVLHQFEGRAKPVAVFGPEESWEVNYSGVLLPDTSTRKEWRDLLNLKQIICYRDCRGRRIFGVIPAITISPANGADWLQFTVTETDYTEGD